jgi:hypothetical protein
MGNRSAANPIYQATVSHDRKREHDPQPRRHNIQLQRGAVELGDGADQAQAKAVARRGAAAFSTIEAVRQMRQVGRCHARSVILHRETRAGFGTAFQTNIDAGARRRVA